MFNFRVLSLPFYSFNTLGPPKAALRDRNVLSNQDNVADIIFILAFTKLLIYFNNLTSSGILNFNTDRQIVSCYWHHCCWYFLIPAKSWFSVWENFASTPIFPFRAGRRLFRLASRFFDWPLYSAVRVRSWYILGVYVHFRHVVFGQLELKTERQTAFWLLRHRKNLRIAGVYFYP